MSVSDKPYGPLPYTVTLISFFSSSFSLSLSSFTITDDLINFLVTIKLPNNHTLKAVKLSTTQMPKPT